VLGSANTYGQTNQDWITPCFHCDPILINDWGMIFQGTASRRFNEKIKGEFNVQSRIMEQFKSLKSMMFEPGIKFNFNKHFALKSAFRFTVQPKTNYRGTNYYYRVHVAGYYVWFKQGKPLRIQFRTRTELESFLFWRNRIKVATNIKDLIKPYSSFEIFNRFGSGIWSDIYRYEGGVKIELHEKYNLTLMFRHEYYNNGIFTPNKTQAVGLMFNYSIGK
jgi:hypothetical protein